MNHYFPRVCCCWQRQRAAAYAQTPGSLGSIYSSNLAAGLAPADSIPLSVPTIDAGGVVSGASFQPGIVPGSWLTIKGSNLSPVASDTWDKAIVNGKLPTTLDGVSVNVGSKPAYVYFISPRQINVQAPDVGTGPVPVTVTTAGGTSVSVTATVAAQVPAFFLWPGNQVVATRNPDASSGGEERHLRGSDHGCRQARRCADSLGHRLWSHHAAGRCRNSSALGQDLQYRVRSPSRSARPNAQVFGSALSPGYAGLYQVAIQVPASMADGDYPIKATVSGVSSPDGVILSVKN